MCSTLSVAYRERIFSKFRTFFLAMFQDFANTLEGAEVEVYYYWLTLLLSNIVRRFLVFQEIFREMMFYQVVGRKVQEGETINRDISGEETIQ